MDAAAECFRKAYLSDTQNLKALENHVEVLIRSGRYAPAAVLASQWTDSHPRCAGAWIARAKLHLVAGELASAKTALTTALEIDPANAAVRSALESLGRGTRGDSAPHSAPRTSRPDSPLPFLRPLSLISKAPVKNDPPVLCVGAALHPGGYSHWTKQTVVWLRRAGMRVGLDKYAGETVDSYLCALDLSDLHSLKEALEERIRDGVLVMIHQPALAVGNVDVYERVRWQYPQQLAYVGMTTFETEGLPKHWVEACHGMDEIWVLSQRDVTEFARGGVDERQLWATGFGLDPAQYEPSRTEPLPVPGRRPFMFLSTFQWQPRKGWPILVEAFARTFSRHDDVCLVIKTGRHGAGEMSADDQITRCLNARNISREQAAPIIVIEAPLGDRDMTSLYRAADAFVLPTRGEGWGIPFMEAMAMGLPTIGTRWGGHLDFMNDSNSYLIDIRGLIVADDEMLKFSPEYRGLRYADPDMEHLMVLLRRVHDERDAAREKGRRARRDILAKWTHTQYAERIRQRCRELIGRAEGRRISSGRACKPPRADLLPVIIHGPALDPCGYAHDFRNMALAMREEGVDVRLDHQRWNQRDNLVSASECADIVSIMNPEPPNGRHISIENPLLPPERNSNAFRVVRVFWETDRIPPKMAAQFAGADEIWVGSSFNVEALARWGIRRDKIKVLPTAVAVERYGGHVQPLPWADERRFTFLACFDVSLRKGWDLLFRAFFDEFKPSENARIVLNVHSSSASHRKDLIRHLERWAKAFAGPAWVTESNEWRLPEPLLCTGEDLHADEMARFYRSGNAYVMPSRGEGWGIPAMEAMASGLPVIATAWGGQMDYMDDETALLVHCKPAPVSADACRENACFAGQMWAEPDLADLRKKMRLAKDQPAVAQSKAAAAQRRVREKYSREAVSALVIERLKDASQRAKSAPRNHGAASVTAARSKKVIVWEGCQLYRSSLALVNRELCSRIAGSRDFRLRLLPLEPEQHAGVCAPQVARRLQSLMGAKSSDPCDVYIRHGWPPDFTRPPHAGKFVIFQHWEYGKIPPAWVEPINRQVDEVWVASRHVFETFVASGVSPEKVWRVPLGVATAVFKPEGLAMNLKTDKKFRFLFVGGTIWRKGIDVLLKGYCSAFGRADDVCLVIKDMGANSFYKGQCAADAIAGLQQQPNAPEVLYLTGDLSEQEMARLYRSCHCLVHPYRGEGFGLPVAEAAACGLPAILSVGGAADDFVPQESAFFVTTRRAAVRLEAFDVDGWVLEPEVKSVAELMRWVFTKEEERRSKAKRLSAHVRNNFSWERAAEVAEMRLKCLCAT